MNEIDKAKLSEQTAFRLSEIISIENYLHQEINQQKSYSKNLNKYATIFDYTDKILIVLNAVNVSVSIISLTSTVGAPVETTSAVFTVLFAITTGIIKKLLNITRNKKKRHDKILMLAKSKLNSIESLISQALNDLDISQEEFITILNEKDKYEKIKYKESEHKKHKIEQYKIKDYFIFFVHNIKMYEVTKKNCYKCDLETISTNDSQYFWINLTDFEAETERNWQNIFNKYGDSSILKYRKELITNVPFQPNRIFVRNDFLKE